ncbi:MAG TPA: 4Fe-4S dicluster domain-containing protein [Geobacteraceae bacterium]
MAASDPIPQVDERRCSGCGRCVAACRSRLLTLDASGARKVARRPSPQPCTRCRACVAACPLGVMT